ncbi:MAG: WGR domain-containing protein [Planctomycetes bacterium]|nr:WGR domain-containing protein [Planctomycetota bacterium]
MKPESVTLYYREGGSDKVYQAQIEPRGEGFVVNFAYGRRGSTFQTGTKTPNPLPLEEAHKIYAKLVASKTAKGYSPGEDGTPYAQTAQADRDTGLRPQLLNAIDESDLERCLQDADFWMQEKFDGRRMLIRKFDGAVTGINRLGLVVALPRPVLEAVQALPCDCVLDGEALGESVRVFDCLQRETADLTAFPYRERWRMLLELLRCRGQALQAVSTAAAAGDKRDLLRVLREAKAEGVVFKSKHAPYTPGRPNSGGTQLKLKFTATASCLVVPGRAGKRSVGLEVLDGRKRIAIGNVTIPGKQPIPAAGQIVEVRYLYAYPGGSLYQPVYLGVRDDLRPASCVVGQLKYRREDTEDDA